LSFSAAEGNINPAERGDAAAAQRFAEPAERTCVFENAKGVQSSARRRHFEQGDA
jgi:hypothetical protein